MASITPVPTTRVSDLLVRGRLLSQLQFDQQDLLRVQTQISTGRRIAAPSEDAPAALRAIELQRLIERKSQIEINMSTSQSFMDATESALSTISGKLADIRGAAISVAGTTSGPEQRQAAIQNIENAINDLVNIGNTQVRGRQLFAGSDTSTVPYDIVNGFVKYNGNEQHLSSYADINLLFETNLNGNEVFGGISEPVRGVADLNPILTENTKLVDLRGGQGISPGSISISDGSLTSVIDLSNAETLGDVMRLIEANPPQGGSPPVVRDVDVYVGPTGLEIQLDTVGGGLLRIAEVGGGTTAAELGIVYGGVPPTFTVNGTDLDPRLTATTSLSDAFGVRSQARIISAGNNNDITVEAKSRGASGDGSTIVFVDDSLVRPGAGLIAGSETATFSSTAVAARASVEPNAAVTNNDILITATTAGTALNNVRIAITTRAPDAGGVNLTYDAVGGSYTIDVEQGVTTALDVVNAIIASGGPFTAALDTSVDGANDGSYVIASTDANPNASNTGNSGGIANTLFIAVQNGVSTANDVVSAINSDATVSQLFSAAVTDKDLLAGLTSGAGAIDVSASAITSGGSGIEFDQTTGIQIVNGGQTHVIDLTTVVTFEDMLNVFNGSQADVFAEISVSGSGLDIRSRLSGTDFAIGENGGTTATELGVRSLTRETRLDDLNHGRGVSTFAGNIDDPPTDMYIQRNSSTDPNDRLAIDLSGAVTIGDVLDRINNHVNNQDPTTQIVARLVASGNGIEIVDDNPVGAGTLQIIKPTLSQAAIDLGLIPDGATQSASATIASAASATAQLTGTNNDLTFTAFQAGTGLNNVNIVITNSGTVTTDDAVVTFSGSTLTIDIDPTNTRAATVLQRVNAQGTFSVILNQTIETTNNGSGLISNLGTVATTAGGAAQILQTGDPNVQETSSVFTSLRRLADALNANDSIGIERAITLLDVDAQRVNFSRAELGAKLQGLDVLKFSTENEIVELRSVLSKEIEVDLTEAISILTARQASFQASLQMMAQTLQVSLLNFL